MGIPDGALDGYDARMNKWDDKLKDFMLLAEKKCRTYKDEQTIRMCLGNKCGSLLDSCIS